MMIQYAHHLGARWPYAQEYAVAVKDQDRDRAKIMMCDL